MSNPNPPGDEPAYPHTSDHAYGDRAGFTKREVIAMHALAALISNGDPRQDDIIARDAVRKTDALLHALTQGRK